LRERPIGAEKTQKMNRLKDFKTKLSLIGLMMGVFVGAIYAQSNSLNGDYRLDTGRSENVDSMVDSMASSEGLTANQQEMLKEQLSAPDTISISTSRSNQVTVKSGSSGSATFQTNSGRQTVTQDDGSQASVTATLRGNTLRLSRVGSGTSYSITFSVDNDGQVLRVTRMITADYLSQTVFADSVYVREGNYSSVDPADDSDDDVFSSSDKDDVSTGDRNGSSANGNLPRASKKVNGRFVVPKGMSIEGTLNNKVTTKASQNNDRFEMTVDSPSDYEGAVISGYLSGIQRTGRATGKSRLTFNFETITLRSGEVYDFAGVLSSITDSTGKIIEVGDEGEAKSKSRTKESVKRGGIGAGLGAILGGILGGGKGAAIGATIGGSAGAGSVIAEGRDDIELLEGSRLKVESSSPDTVNR